MGMGRMNIGERISVRLCQASNIVANFPGNLARIPEIVAARMRKVARFACGCSHECASSCALYRKSGPAKCACACHTASAADVTGGNISVSQFVYTVRDNRYTHTSGIGQA